MPAPPSAAPRRSSRPLGVGGSALVLAAAAAGCGGSGGAGDPAQGDDLSFASEGAEASAAESDAQVLTSSLVSPAATTIGLASVELSGTDLGASDIGDGARAIYLPRACLDVVHDAGARTVTYTFDGCLGPNGLLGVSGRVTARYAVADGRLHLELTAEALRVNGALVDWTATADISASEGGRTMAWKGQLQGVGAGEHAFTRTSDVTLSWRVGEPCLSVSGTSSGVVRADEQAASPGRELRTKIESFRRCRRGCPEAGGQITVTDVARAVSVELRYDGTNRATFVGPSGVETSVPLLCRP